MIEDFEVGEFTEFSDHAPICLTFRIYAETGDNSCTCVKYKETYTTWNSENADQIYQCLLINRDTLAACTDDIVDINQSIQIFSKTLKDITDGFCQKTYIKLELMFMKHYAPNRCLYIKVAKLRTGVGSAEMSHLQNRCLKISG